MRITLIQTYIHWEDREANLAHFGRLISEASQTDLIILPEMFSTGFTMDPASAAEEMSGDAVNWMKSVAGSHNCAVAGSLAIKEGVNFYNRLIFTFPDGQLEFYDKRHLFTLAGENKVYTAGNDKKIIEYKGWKICLQVCYDLRFPVFSRNAEDYDLLIYVANWPGPRISAWNSLLKARAIENMCYVAAVNRIGFDANGNEYPGDSQILDCMGEHAIEPMNGNQIASVELSKGPMVEARRKFGFLDDRDRFTVM